MPLDQETETEASPFSEACRQGLSCRVEGMLRKGLDPNGQCTAGNSGPDATTTNTNTTPAMSTTTAASSTPATTSYP